MALLNLKHGVPRLATKEERSIQAREQEQVAIDQYRELSAAVAEKVLFPKSLCFLMIVDKGS